VAQIDIIRLLIVSVVLPFVAAPVSFLVRRSLASIICAASSAISFAAILLASVGFAMDGKQAFSQDLVSLHGIVILGFTVDRISVLIGFAASLVGLFVCIYSVGYMALGNREHPEAGKPRYFFFMQVFVGAMAGLVFSSTISGQLFFYEITGVCSWGLIAYYDTPKALSTGTKALIVEHIGSLGLYFAAALFFVTAGSFSLSALGSMVPAAKTAIILGILFAAWGKSAQFPLHIWLPDAMEAPTPVSAYLHAGSMVNIGVFIYARALLSAGDVPHLVGAIGAVAATITLIYAFFMYLPQLDLKRLLVYSTITQLASIFLALSLSTFGSTLAFNGGVAHIFNHAFAKSLFFLVAGCLSFTTGTRMLPRLHGLLTKMPLVAISFGTAALAIAGVPPMNLFFSHFAMLAGSFQASRNDLPLLVLVVISVLEAIGTFGWFLKKFGDAVPGPSSPTVAAATALPVSMAVALVGLVALTLCSGTFAAAWVG
jgi:hydrogenase-4 component D